MTGPNVRERILPRLIEDELKESFLDYSMSVIVQRALPDVRDGLKPVHRRILYAMHELGLVPGRPYKKAATVVGDVLGKYHPHGDIAVYDSLVRMVQDFSLRYPLIDGQGNFGSVDGDSAAAYRYTEARLTRVAMTMLEDIDKNTVAFVPNFDDRLKEPTVLPDRGDHLRPRRHQGVLRERSRSHRHPSARDRGREGIDRQAADRGDGVPVSGQSRARARADPRPRARQEARRHQRRPERVRQGRDPARDRAEARRHSDGRAQPALQAYANAADLRR